MNLNPFHIGLRSVSHYRLPSLYQFLIILFLSAIITGSILTGVSVRKSLLENNQNRLYGTGVVVSSGPRYFPLSLSTRLEEESGEKCAGILELKGWVRNYNTGESALNVQAFGVNNDFFDFSNHEYGIKLNKGETAINRQLADRLGLSIGEDIILRVGNISSIPSGSPFAPESDPYESMILTVKAIISDGAADFSLGISQIRPLSVFVSLADFEDYFPEEPEINRIIILESSSLSITDIDIALTKVIGPEDIGLRLKKVDATGQIEIISDRVFIASNELDEILAVVPEGRPIITYLANKLTTKHKTTPYSFVSALNKDIYENAPLDNEITINSWLAKDLNAEIGDSIEMEYYVMGDYKKLIEKNYIFIISDIVQQSSIWSDESLMPEFPGISGSESCSNWDAGVPVDMNSIREKDEDYWNEFKGTPKAFINYSTGRKLWGNDFGPATAIRFPVFTDQEEVLERLRGNINPLNAGFSITGIKEEVTSAANNSVDFSTLFLSLGFFIILSSLVLLALVVSTQFESRKNQVSTLRAIGFGNKLIGKIFFIESGIIALVGSIAGSFAGSLFNRAIIGLLNSVWQGAVQTSTLKSFFDIQSIIIGFSATFLMVLLVLGINLRKQLKEKRAKQVINMPEMKTYVNYIFISFILITLVQILLALPGSDLNTLLWFTSGVTLFISFLLGYRVFINFKFKKQSLREAIFRNISWSYYAHFPSRALTPVLFLAAGLFIIIITGSNRKSFNTDTISRQSGTGGYILWAETAIPLKYDLNSPEGRKEYGLIDDNLSDLLFIQSKKADGDDASCLNLNQVKSPPVLGIDVSHFLEESSFAFASVMKGHENENPWNALNSAPSERTIYGIVDQTVLQWSLHRKVGDTLTLSTEDGGVLNIIITGGLESSVFQGHILIGTQNFNQFFPSISGSNIFLVDGDTDHIEEYRNLLSDRFSGYGAEVNYSYDRLAAFNEVTNTYLTVFMTLGGLGLVMGVLGLGFVLLRNFNLRKKEYAVLLASGYTYEKVRNSIMKEQYLILIAGILAGLVPAPLATIPSLISDSGVPVGLLLIITALIFITGALTIFISVRRLVKTQLISILRKD